jgi:phage shock protein B
MAWIEAPLLVFLTVVLPVWLFLHYRSKRPQGPTATPTEDSDLAALWQQARRMEDRIATLERILDADHPNWRGRA